MQNNIVAFCDVDDSLITTARTAPDSNAEPCAVDADGKVCAFITAKQLVLNKLLGANAQVVITTARTTKGLANVTLPIATGYAIVSFGGVILDADGVPVPEWHRRMKKGACDFADALNEVLVYIKLEIARLNIDARARLVTDAGLPLFLSVKHNQKNLFELGLIEKLTAQFISQRMPVMAIHSNGNFMAVLPPFLRKEYAVQWFKDNIAAAGALTIGLGDSVTDMPFAGLCDYVLIPSQSQAFTHLQKNTKKI